jgi:aspartate kinase
MEDIVVRGVTLKKDLARVLLMGVPNHPGIASKIFARIAQHSIVVDDIIQNIVLKAKEANIGFTTSRADAKEAAVVCGEMAKELGIRQVEVDEKLAKVSIVGVGMKTHTGVASKMFAALAEAQINIQNITTSEIVISCIVDEKDGERAIQVLHSAFSLDQPENGRN